MPIRILAALLAGLMLAGAPAHAASLEEITARIEALERENGALRARVQELEARRPPAPAPAARPAPVLRTATPILGYGGAPSIVPEAVPASVPEQRWNRFYAGVRGGYTVAGPEYGHVHPQVFAGSRFTGKAEGWTGGGQIGRDIQLGNWVLGLGVEGRAGDVGAVTSGMDQAGAGLVQHRGLAVATLDVDWSASAFGRVGYGGDNWLVYGAGGVALAEVSEAYEGLAVRTEIVDFQQQSVAVDGQLYDSSGVRTGFAAGFGFEWAFTRHLSLGLEYQYLNFGSRSLGAATPSTTLDWHNLSGTLNVSF